MPTTQEMLTITALFLVPGYLFSWGFSAIIVRQRRDPIAIVLESIAASLCLWLLVLGRWVQPDLAETSKGLALNTWVGGLAVTMGPAVLGVVGGLFFRGFPAALSSLGLRTTPPKAWDCAFQEREPSVIRVTLDNGTMIAGIWCSTSFASVYPEAEDLYLEPLVALDENGTPSGDVLEGMGTWVPAKSIRLLEFIPAEVRS